MIHVPEKFQPHHPFPYPPDNEIEFERWYLENYDFQDTEREYLPVLWTAYYCRHKFGQHKPAMVDLQKFLNGLDRPKKLYTIVQYDNGIIHDLSHLDIKVFSMSGGRTDYPLPLISIPHGYSLRPNGNRNTFANFIGKATHPIRDIMLKAIPRLPEYYINTAKHDLYDYCRIIANSVFTLCPRGYGPTSFRIQEALQYGSIPVYISDEWVIPHNIPFTDYGVLIDAADAHRVHDILMSIPPEEIRRKREAIPEVYQKYFTYEGCRERIKEHLKSHTFAI
jgi:hypothetical protein